MIKPIHFFAASHRQAKYIIFFSSMTLLFSTLFFVSRYCYESCILLCRQTKRIYKAQKRFIPAIQEKEITQLKTRVSAKLKEKKKYQKILTNTHRLFHDFSAIKKALKEMDSTLIHCSLSAMTISLTVECTNQRTIDQLIERLRREKQFFTVKLRTTEKKATTNNYVCTIVISPPVAL